MNNKFRYKEILLYFLGLLICTLPVFCAAVAYFPEWIERSDGSAISGFFLLILILAATPIFKALRMIFHSPAAYVMWLIAFLLFFSLEKIAHEMTVISFVGFLSNLCGAVLFKFAASRKDK